MKKKTDKKYKEKIPWKDRKKYKSRFEGNKSKCDKSKFEGNEPRFDGNVPRFEGEIVDPMKDILFHVCLDNTNKIVLGYLSGNMRRHHIQVVGGDKVLIELPESSSKKGRIVYRITSRRVPSANQQTFMEQLEDDQQVKEPSESSKDTETTNTISNNPLKPSDQKERRKEKRDSKDKNDNPDLTD